jgi:hypothetical protein
MLFWVSFCHLGLLVVISAGEHHPLPAPTDTSVPLYTIVMADKARTGALRVSFIFNEL